MHGYIYVEHTMWPRIFTQEKTCFILACLMFSWLHASCVYLGRSYVSMRAPRTLLDCWLRSLVARFALHKASRMTVGRLHPGRIIAPGALPLNVKYIMLTLNTQYMYIHIYMCV